MGTTCMYLPKGQERAEVEGLFNWTNGGVKSTVLAISKVGAIYYAAVKREGAEDGFGHEMDADGAYVFGAVVKTSRYDGEFCYKEMSEDSLPYYYDAPEKILSLLSPTTNENALEWRRKCREAAASKKAIKALKTGDRIKLASPVSFGGVSCDEFTVTSYRTRGGKQRRCFFHPQVGKCRLGSDSLMGFTLLEG